MLVLVLTCAGVYEPEKMLPSVAAGVVTATRLVLMPPVTSTAQVGVVVLTPT